MFYVEENAPVGFAVADVVASDPDSTKLLTYQVLKFDGYQPDGEKITLNEVIITLTTSRVVILIYQRESTIGLFFSQCLR